MLYLAWETFRGGEIREDHSRDGFIIRRNAIETGVNVLTAMDTAQALITSWKIQTYKNLP